eukprot:2723240-Lingulodinium_polyedra.AAC.1
MGGVPRQCQRNRLHTRPEAPKRRQGQRKRRKTGVRGPERTARTNRPDGLKSLPGTTKPTNAGAR